MLKYKIVPEAVLDLIKWAVYTRVPNDYFGWRWKFEGWRDTEDKAVYLVELIANGTTYYDQSGEEIK